MQGRDMHHAARCGTTSNDHQHTACLNATLFSGSLAFVGVRLLGPSALQDQKIA